jgi:membrane associated rhomboid family serine protease
MKTTHLIIALNVLIYLAMLKFGQVDGSYAFTNLTLLHFGAGFGPLVQDGEWWRLVTSTFIHITPIHIGMNMIALYQVGVVLEPHYGRVRYALLYLAAGLGGSLASLAWNWNHPVVSAGASGAISGLIAAGAVSGHMLIGLSKDAKRFRDSMVRWLVLIVAYGLFAHVDAAAHGGGMAVGAGVAWLLDGRGGAIRRAQKRERDPGFGLDVIILLVVFGGSFYLASRAQHPELLQERSQATFPDDGDEDPAVSDAMLAMAKEAVDNNPASTDAHARLAGLYASFNRAEDCVTEARSVMKLAPASRIGYGYANICLRELGRDAEAKEILADAARHGVSFEHQNNSQPGGSVGSLRAQLAMLACAHQQWEKCAEEARTAVKLAPDDAGGWVALKKAAHALGDQKQADEAQHHLDQLRAHESR